MLNNGQHYLVEFTQEVANKIGIPARGSLWPSQVDQMNHSGSIWMHAERVYAVEVEGLRFRSLYLVKDKSASKILHLDIEAWEVYDHNSFKEKFEAFLETPWTSNKSN